MIETNKARLLTTAETAQALGITASQVSLLIRQGKLPAEKHGRDWLVKESDLKNFERTPVGRSPSKKSGGKSK
jgi:excisionase family DNA binding protein